MLINECKKRIPMLANVSAIRDLSLPFANANRLPAPIRAQLNIVEL